MILGSSLIINLLRCFLPLPILVESFFLGEIFLQGGLFGILSLKTLGHSVLEVTPRPFLGMQCRSFALNSLGDKKFLISNFVTKDFPSIYSYDFRDKMVSFSPEVEQNLIQMSIFCQNSVIKNQPVLLPPHEIMGYMLALDN